MSANRANVDAIEQMRAANPVSAAELRAAIGEEELRRQLGAAIAAGESARDPLPLRSSAKNDFAVPPVTQRGIRAGRGRMTLLAGLCGAALTVLAVFLIGAPGSGGHPSFATAAIKVAEANPRLLVTAPGWSVIDAGEFEAGEGEVTFGDGRLRLSINWYPTRMYRSYLRDRASVSRPRTSRLLGRVATTVHYVGAEYATMLSPQGIVFLEIRGRLHSHAEYEAVLRSLRPVDVDTWLSALPPNVVRPGARAGMVERMLRGVPLPPGFDLAHLEGEDSVLNHYQLAARVAGAVSCGWVESWLAATRAGDRSRAKAAVEAMATSRRWPMMPVLAKGGGWSANVWQAARAIASGHLDRGPAGALVRPDGTGYALGPSWAVGLNCTSRYWRRPFKR